MGHRGILPVSFIRTFFQAFSKRQRKKLDELQQPPQQPSITFNPQLWLSRFQSQGYSRVQPGCCQGFSRVPIAPDGFRS